VLGEGPLSAEQRGVRMETDRTGPREGDRQDHADAIQAPATTPAKLVGLGFTEAEYAGGGW